MTVPALATSEGGVAALATKFDDGGRAAAGFKGKTGDCVARAITIATGKQYREVYNALWAANRQYANSHRGYVARKIKRGGGRSGATPRNGIFKDVSRPYLQSLGWKWTLTMQIGSGCRVHLRAGELPAGRLIVKVSRYLVAVIDGVIHDTYDCSHGGTRCVYGYWTNRRANAAAFFLGETMTDLITITTTTFDELARAVHELGFRRQDGELSWPHLEPEMKALTPLFRDRVTFAGEHASNLVCELAALLILEAMVAMHLPLAHQSQPPFGRAVS